MSRNSHAKRPVERKRNKNTNEMVVDSGNVAKGGFAQVAAKRPECRLSRCRVQPAGLFKVALNSSSSYAIFHHIEPNIFQFRREFHFIARQIIFPSSALLFLLRFVVGFIKFVHCYVSSGFFYLFVDGVAPRQWKIFEIAKLIG